MPMMIVLMIVTEKVLFRHLHWCNVRSAIRINRNEIRCIKLRFIYHWPSVNNDLYLKRQETARGEARGDNYQHLRKSRKLNRLSTQKIFYEILYVSQSIEIF